MSKDSKFPPRSNDLQTASVVKDDWVPEDPRPKIRALFDVKCSRRDGNLACLSGRRLTEGTRIHVTYYGGTVTPRALVGLKGAAVLSGSDSVVVRTDGVLGFETRLTIGTPRITSPGSSVPAAEHFKRDEAYPENAFVFNMLVSGVVVGTVDDPLRGHVAMGTESQAVGQVWRGAGKQRVALPTLIEASTGPIPRAAQPLLQQLADNFKKIGGEDLAHQCLSVGTVEFQNGAVEVLQLTVYSVTP